MILLHKNLDKTPDEKDISIRLLGSIDDKLSILKFKIPRKTPCKMSNPNHTYLSEYLIELNNLLGFVSIPYSDIDFMFNNFHLATLFVVNNTFDVTHRWDEGNKIMYLSY